MRGSWVRSGLFVHLVFSLCLILLVACTDAPADKSPSESPQATTVLPTPTRTHTPKSTSLSKKPANDATENQAREQGIARASEPLFEEDSCPFETPDNTDITCGYLTTPEDRSKPEGMHVSLAVAIIHSLDDHPEPDPIFYFEGGPGNAALTDIDAWIDMGFADRRDFIIFDQRGTGHSTPLLNCPEWDEIDDTIEATRACHERLVSEDINLAMYNSATSAADFHDLRRALGYAEQPVNIYGISYGTRLALTIMRDYPAHIRSAVLDSPYPPVADSYGDAAPSLYAALNRLFEDCAADPDCNEEYPNLKNVFYDMVDELDKNPVEVEYTDPETDETYEKTITGQDLIGSMTSVLYDSEIIPELPGMFYEIADGNEDVLSTLVWEEWNDEDGESRGERKSDEGNEDDEDDEDWSEEETDTDSEGMYYSVECFEEVGFASRRNVRSQARELPESLQTYFLDDFEEQRAICDFWGAGKADDIEKQPVTSSIPTLIVAGEYDPGTPIEWGKQAAESLDHSFFYVLPRQGHSASFDGGCATDMVLEFLDDPTHAPDDSCLETLEEESEFTLP